MEHDGISSKAVVKYESPASITSYTQLAKDTDLNRPPSNWLRDNLVGKFPYQDAKKTEPFDYSSLLMASRYPEIIGEVDVVAGGNMIKKLLTMPFSDSSLSMSVQRVGNTLLLNQLDVPTLLQSPYYNNNLKWLRELYCEASGIPLTSELHPKKRNKEKSELQLILSKFMYYSIEGGESMLNENPKVEYPNSASYSLMKSDKRHVNDEVIQPAATLEDELVTNDISTVILNDDKNDSVVYPNDKEDDGIEQPVVHSSFNKIDFHSSEDSSEPVRENVRSDSFYSRDVLWTFEDITMLVGSDLPIFGGGKYPAVSLRLRDSSKPINILTGIDYWLDNLMCNVPELIMCFHLKGIVQKYERIKTSDLPDLEGSNFSPKVIKDIAQNVLSFLKANCTKEGHTYWLYRSCKEDVIKLYDLTSICRMKTEEKQQDPFSVSVAVLLYNIARNMYTSGEINSRNIGKIRSLLKNCTTLLESKERADISLLANLLLIDLYRDEEDESDIEDNPSEDESSEEQSCSTDDDSLECEISGEPIKSVSVKALGFPSKRIESKSDKPISVLNEESRSKNSIFLMINALRSLDVLICNEKCKAPVAEMNCIEKRNEDMVERKSSKIELWKRKENNLELLDLIDKDLKFFNLHSKKKINYRASSWGELRRIILEKIVESFLTLINITISKEKFGRALRFIQSCCYCLENAKRISTSSSYNRHLCVEILKLYGDILTIMANKNMHSEAEEFNALNENDSRLRILLEYDDNTEFCGVCIKEIADNFKMSNEELLNAATNIYEDAITLLDTNTDKNTLSYQMIDLSRRLGNIRNELGVLYMNKAASISRQYGIPSEQEMSLWKRSFSLYEGAIMSFKIVDDRPNMALLYMNCAKLMLLCAQVYGNSTKESIDKPRGPFTQEEKTYFNKSYEYYQKGLSILNSKDSYPSIWTNVSLELSHAYLTMAVTMQEHAAKSMDEEKVIKDIASALMKALQYSESVVAMCDKKQQTMIQGRIGSIHQRLATLYYRVFKNQVSDSGKRNYRSLSELHYKKVYEVMKADAFPMKILQSIVEQNVFYDHILMQSFSWKYLKLKLEIYVGGGSETERTHCLLPALQEVLRRLKSKHDKSNVSVNRNSSESDEVDVRELKKLLTLLYSQMNAALREAVKFLSNKKQKKNESIDVKRMKKVYEIVLRNHMTKDDNILLNISSFINVLLSVRNICSC